jgi:hypothetical protein
MVTGRVIDHDPYEGTYSLPPEHAAWLTRAAEVDNMAITSLYIPLIAEVEQQVIAEAASRTRRTRGSTASWPRTGLSACAEPPRAINEHHQATRSRGSRTVGPHPSRDSILAYWSRSPVRLVHVKARRSRRNH